MKKIDKRELEHYMGLDWTYTIRIEVADGKKYYVIGIQELPGVCTHGFTFDEAMKNIREALEGSIMFSLERGAKIPVPLSGKDYRGNISYRTTANRHYHLAQEAQRRKLSLSKTLDALIDASLGQH